MSQHTETRVTEKISQQFAVFLSHNSREKSAVERIAEKLKRAEIEPWLDKWCLTAGGDWQTELAAGLRASGACAVFIGPNGIGDWEDLEYKLANDRAAKDRNFRLFLVLLPGLPEPFDPSTLPPFLLIRTWVDLRSGIEDTRAFQSLINAVKGLPLGPERPIEARDDICPYRGLQAFDEEHADYFFGRDADIQRLLERLKITRFIGVIGSSGSGKSSLVRAGVVPALKKGVLAESDTWTIRVFTPTAHPLAALAANLLRLFPQGSMNQTLDEMSRDERTLHLAVALALAERPAAERVVLVVDQFEEVFTLCRDERERAAFIANLLYAAFIPNGRIAVLLTLRADFYPKCATYPELSARIAAQQFLVSPMDVENLKQAIEEPAWQTGLEFEPGLVETILEDVESQPGALPLLEHALMELWERRRGSLLTLEAYRESGGVEGAIAKRADAIYSSFNEEQQQIVRRIMLRLTQPGEGTEDTRRRATMDELVTRPGESNEVEGVAQMMANARLLTTGSDEQPDGQTIDVSHEALIRGWPRLRKWIEEDRAGLRILRRLTDAAREWQPTKDESLLYRGARLAQAVEWRERNEAALNELEREFLNASVAARQAIERRRRRVLTGLAAGLVFAIALAVLALVQWWRANDQTELAHARQLAAESYALMEQEPDLGLLLGVEATRIRESFVPRRTLLLDMQYREHLSMFLHGHTADVHQVVFSSDGKMLASSSGANGKDNTVRLWDAVTGQPLGEALTGHQADVWCVAFSPDGKLLASGDDKGVVILWDVAARRMIGQPLTGHQQAVYSLAFSPDNKILASGSFVQVGENGSEHSGEIRLWNVATRELMGAPLLGHSSLVQSLAFSPDGRTLASGNGRYFPVGLEASIILWDVATRRPAGTPLMGHDDSILSLAFSPDGRVLASGSADEKVRLWDVGLRQPLNDFERLEADFPRLMRHHETEVLEVKFTRDGKNLISADADNRILVREVEFSTVNNRLSLSASSPIKYFASYSSRETKSLTFSTETFKWATAGCRKLGPDGSCAEADLSVWDTAARLPISRLITEDSGNSIESAIEGVAFSPDGKVLVTASDKLYLWDTANGQPLGQLGGSSQELSSVAYSPDGKILAAGSCAKIDERDIGQTCAQGEIRLWNADTRQPLPQPLLGHTGSVTMLVFSPDGKTLASSDGNNIILWNVETRQSLGEIRTGHLAKEGSSVPNPIISMAFSPDGKTLASGGCRRLEQTPTPNGETQDLCTQGEVRFWNAATRELSGQPLTGHKDGIWSLAFSPDGKALASASGQHDGTIKLWDLSTRQRLGRDFTGATSAMRKLVFSPDGATLVSISDSGPSAQSIFLWDIGTRQLIGQPLAGHRDKIQDIAFSPDGRWLASGDRGKKLILWDMKLEAWKANACRVANRNLTRREWQRYFADEPYHKTCPNLPEPNE